MTLAAVSSRLALAPRAELTSNSAVQLLRIRTSLQQLGKLYRC